MKIFKKVILVVSIIAVIILGFLWYMGFFAPVHIQEKQEGGFTVVGMSIIGPYSKAGQHINEVDSKLKGLGIISTKGFGIYYDDPKNTPKDKCRSLVGNIIENKDLEKVKDLQLNDLKIDSIPNAKSIVIEFPIKNMMSYMIGPMKVYPVFTRYMKEKKYKPTLSFEVYDMVKNKIQFVMQYTIE